MGIRTDSDLQQISIEDGSNPYTKEDLKAYSFDEINKMCNHNDELFRLFDEIGVALSNLDSTIERLSPIMANICDNVERLKAEIDEDGTLF